MLRPRSPELGYECPAMNYCGSRARVPLASASPRFSTPGNITKNSWSTAFASDKIPQRMRTRKQGWHLPLHLSQNRRTCIPSDGTPTSAFARVQQQRRSCGMDSRDLCLDHRTGDLGTSMPTQTCSRDQELTVWIPLVNIQTQGGPEITNGVLTIRKEFC